MSEIVPECPVCFGEGLLQEDAPIRIVGRRYVHVVECRQVAVFSSNEVIVGHCKVDHFVNNAVRGATGNYFGHRAFNDFLETPRPRGKWWQVKAPGGAE